MVLYKVILELQFLKESSFLRESPFKRINFLHSILTNTGGKGVNPEPMIRLIPHYLSTD